MQLPGNVTRRKKCKKCEFVYEGKKAIEIGFYVIEKRKGIPFRFSNTCKPCYQTQRTERTRKNRWREKARNTLRSHSKRLGIPQEDLREKHGWNIDQMAEDMEFAYQNGCPECHEAYSEMEHGPRDITLDIWDKRLEPGYSNTKYMCDTCNKAKGEMTPEDWIILKRLWRERDIFLAEKLLHPEPEQLKLFDKESEENESDD